MGPVERRYIDLLMRLFSHPMYLSDPRPSAIRWPNKWSQAIIRGILSLMFSLVLMSTAASESRLQLICSITLVQWQSPDHDRIMLDDPALRDLIRAWMSHDLKQGILLTYPAGESGALWARRFRAWLVSFGVPRRFVQLHTGDPGASSLNLTLVSSRQGGY